MSNPAPAVAFGNAIEQLIYSDPELTALEAIGVMQIVIHGLLHASTVAAEAPVVQSETHDQVPVVPAWKSETGC
jgi:hypothetical protein